MVGLELSKARAPTERCRGEHIHHGYFLEPTDTKERAQERLIELLLEKSHLARGSSVLDVGCGIGGTSRCLAEKYSCEVTGITISAKQVELAKTKTGFHGSSNSKSVGAEEDGSLPCPSDRSGGAVRFLELDAEMMGEYFAAAPNITTFDCVWISEAMSHLPNKQLFFDNSYKVLKPQGKLVIADWFKADALTAKQAEADIKPIEGSVTLVFGYRSTATDRWKMACYSHRYVLKRNTVNWQIKLVSGSSRLPLISAIRCPRHGN